MPNSKISSPGNNETLLAGQRVCDLLNQVASVESLDAMLTLLGTQIHELGVADAYLINLVDAELKNIRAKTLVIQSWSDLLFPIADARLQVEKLSANGTQVEFRELDSAAGHIGGVTEIAKEGEAIQRFLNS